ncbi:MAG: beta-propeller domain-containing protein [Solirubrobacterales bacterium]
MLGAVPAPALALRRAAQVRPRAFASCARLVGYERTHFAVTHGVPETSPRPLSEPSIAAPSPPGSASPPTAAAPVENAGTTVSGTSFSTTNNQEPGIEEPDIVKTDGSTIFTVEQGTLYAVLAAGPAPRLAGSLALGGTGYGAQLLLRGSRLLVISPSQAPPIVVGVAVPARPAAVGGRSSALSRIAPVAPAPSPSLALSPSPALSPSLVRSPSIAPSPYYYAATTTITEVDVHDPAAMTVARTMTVEGTFVDARQNGATARLVFSSAPRAIATPALRAHASGWVPARRFHSFITGHRYTRPLAACSAVRRPAQFSGVGMLSILTIDLDRGLYATDSTALMADAQVVYGSSSSLYVATQRWIDPLTPARNVPSSPETVIDQFDATNPDHTALTASGEVPGYLLNQFSLSEYHGYLRVASTSRPIWWNATQPPPSQSYVTVLADRGGVLAAVGQVSGLGAGEQIYSVRFIGDAGYVVTFKRVDPLYTIDLSSPSSPRVAGQLELEGYSAYLHPVAEGLLLGIGQEVGPGNEPSGAQLELFDVSNPAAPRLQARTTLGSGSSSLVQYDHHAFLFWPPTALAVLPVSIYPTTPISVPPTPQPLPAAGASGGPASTVEPTGGFVGAIGFRIDRSGIAEVARIAHDPVNGASPQIDRSLVIGQQLFTVSSEGVMASSLATLARQAFVTFPSPPPAGGGTTSSPPGAPSG